MKEFKYVITDAEGIHARPATMLVKKAAGFKSDINIEAEGKKVNAKGVLGVMGLGAKKDVAELFKLISYSAEIICFCVNCKYIIVSLKV